MFFNLSKILLFLIAPLSWIVILAIIASVSKNSVRIKQYLTASCIILIFFSNSFVFDRFMNAWEVKAIPEDKIPNCEAAIVLTGMVTYDNKIKRLEFNSRTDRVLQAISLYKEKKINRIILCGGPSTLSGEDIMEAPELKLFLVKAGISEDNVLVESKSRNTHENAVFMKDITSKLFPGERFILITSGWHMRRAAACFYKEGIQIIPYSTDRYSGQVKFDIDYLFIPSAETLFNWEKLIHEWMGCIVYKLAGYI